jgi:hypothetical protein
LSESQSSFPELLARIVQDLIEHDRWKVLENHRHEKELALLGAGVHRNPSQPDQFNSETSGGECGPAQEGLIAKAKVAAGAARESGADPIQTALLTASWCGKRLGRWPSAKDSAKAIQAVRDDFEKAVKEHGVSAVLEAVDSMGGGDFRIVAGSIERLRELRDRSVTRSPLFVEFAKFYPHIDLDQLEGAYNGQGGNFVAAAIYVLRREFKKQPPSDLDIDSTHWLKSWSQHLPRYLELWQKELRVIEKRMRIAQKAWEASTF